MIKLKIGDVSDIKSFKKSKPKEYIVCGKYENGWEEVYTATTQLEAIGVLRDYNRNEPEFQHKLKVKNIK